MNKRRWSVYTFLVLIVTISLAQIVSAQQFFGLNAYNMRYATQGIIDSFVGFASPFFEVLFGDYSTSEFFFAKVLLFFLLVIVINAVLKAFPFFERSRNKAIPLLVAVIISILSVRFISQNQLVEGILLPYGTLGVAITTLFPFIIFFYFLHITSIGSTGRRLSWIFFAIIFLVLWNSRFDQFSSIANQIYGWTFVAIILAFIFDRGIHRYFATHELNRFISGANAKTIAMLQAEYLNILAVDTPTAKTRRRHIEQQLAALGADLP